MTYGIIDRNIHEFYTSMSKVLSAMGDVSRQYNWLIADCECYPADEKTEELLSQEYCWLTGEELSELVRKEDFQWIWGVLCAFDKSVSPEEVLSFPLPSARDYDGYYNNPVSLQHPLAITEIVPSDSSWTLIISKDKAVIDNYKCCYPEVEELSLFNQK